MTAEAFNKIAGGLKEAIAGGTAPEIARRLSRAQREAVMAWDPCNDEIMRSLEPIGLSTFQLGVWHFTEAGLAVRSIIEQEGGK